MSKQGIEDLETDIAELKWKVQGLQNFREDIVYCNECGVAILKDKAKSIKQRDFETFYCDRHAPKYSKIVYEGSGYGSTFKETPKYYRDNVEVSSTGKIIK